MPFRMALEVPNDLFRPMSASSSCYFLSLCAHFYCSPLPGTPPALCADRGLATMEEVSRSKMVVRDKMLATRNFLVWASTTEEWCKRLHDDYWLRYQHLICIFLTALRIFVFVWIFVLKCFNFVNDTINFLDIASYLNCNNCAQRQISMCVSHRGKWVGWPV